MNTINIVKTNKYQNEASAFNNRVSEMVIKLNDVSTSLDSIVNQISETSIINGEKDDVLKPYIVSTIDSLKTSVTILIASVSGLNGSLDSDAERIDSARDKKIIMQLESKME